MSRSFSEKPWPEITTFVIVTPELLRTVTCGCREQPGTPDTSKSERQKQARDEVFILLFYCGLSRRQRCHRPKLRLQHAMQSLHQRLMLGVGDDVV